MQLNAEALFQFHEGPIKAIPVNKLFAVDTTFQFHEGPIKALLRLILAILWRCFNSMKVRLKHFWTAKGYGEVGAFQFHEGPIKALV
mgnify:CR=1 FL=1